MTKKTNNNRTLLYIVAGIWGIAALGLLVLVSAALFLPAFAPPPTPTTAPSNTPAPTKTPIPTDTPEPTVVPISPLIPLNEIDLEPILIHSGDLPSGYEGGQVRVVAPSMFKDIPTPDNQIYQEIQAHGDQYGGVAIFLYQSPEALELAYQSLASGLGEAQKPLTSGGEKGAIVYLDVLGSGTISDVLFIRCSALVHFRMINLAQHSAYDQMGTYAQRLDERLKNMVCRQK